MSILFTPWSIASLEPTNRFVRSATWEGMATDDGRCTEQLLRCMERLGKGRVGLIITGHAFVSPEGKASPWQMGISSAFHEAGLQEMVKRVHATGAKICCQLAHGGMRCDEKITGHTAIGPGAEDALGNIKNCRAMTLDDISRITEAFAQAAVRARNAGFDAVQIHAAHGYLLSQFLSGQFNMRTDHYGGNQENRERLVLEVYTAIRRAVGNNYPVTIKLNAHNYMKNMFKRYEGYTTQSMLSVCSKLAEAGIDAVELSGGVLEAGRYNPIRMGMIKPEKEGYHRVPARAYKEAGIPAPLMLVGGIRSFEKAEEFVDKGITDAIALCRPLICEPHLVKRWEEGERAVSLCKSDNLCFKPARAGEGLYCYLRKVQSRKSKE